jgi:aminoglycoside phosphotransferase (APT) family kinase protein
MDAPEPALDAFLHAQGLAREGERARWTPLAGGVTSDIWHVELPGRSLCVKRALARLKVAAEWTAPVSRNHYEWQWLRFAAAHCPLNVPQPLAHDAQAGLFAMAYLDPAAHPLWKRQLLDGHVDVATAAAVGALLAELHDASAGRPELARSFDTLDNFHALRLEPYLLATAARHPDLADRLEALVRRTESTATALVHGDVSPKNILVGPHGPVLLDAECAWYGDPAFDLAFCLNHLLLKCLVQPAQQDALVDSFAALSNRYLDGIHFEPRALLERRAASLLPGLFLARVDGKSPVEYRAGDEPARQLVREAARPLIADPPETLGEVAQAWRTRLSQA